MQSLNLQSKREKPEAFGAFYLEVPNLRKERHSVYDFSHPAVLNLPWLYYLWNAICVLFSGPPKYSSVLSWSNYFSKHYCYLLLESFPTFLSNNMDSEKNGNGIFIISKTLRMFSFRFWLWHGFNSVKTIELIQPVFLFLTKIPYLSPWMTNEELKLINELICFTRTFNSPPLPPKLKRKSTPQVFYAHT